MDNRSAFISWLNTYFKNLTKNVILSVFSNVMSTQKSIELIQAVLLPHVSLVSCCSVGNGHAFLTPISPMTNSINYRIMYR